MLRTMDTERKPGALVVGLVLAVLTVVTWLVALPWRWTLQPTGEQDTFESAVPTSRFVIVAVVLVVLAVASGALGHPVVPIVAVAGPAFLLWCYQAANSETVGANLWIVGAIFLVPVAFGGAAVAGFIGSRARKVLA